MNTKNIKVGNTYKNYKALCEVLGERVKAGNSKIRQIKNWDRFFKYTRHKNEWEITEIFDIPKEKIDGKSLGNNTKYDPIKITHPQLYESIIKDDENFDYERLTRYSSKEINVECEECGVNYKTTVSKATAKKSITCQVCSMSEGERRIYNFLTDNNVNFIKEHTFDDLLALNGIKKLRYDFAIFENEELKGIVEFDGGYHFEETNLDGYEKQHHYDVKKDDYCSKHNIPLKRIPYMNMDKIEITLCKFLSDIGFKDNFYDMYVELINKERMRILNKINDLHNELDKLEEL